MSLRPMILVLALVAAACSSNATTASSEATPPEDAIPAADVEVDTDSDELTGDDSTELPPAVDDAAQDAAAKDDSEVTAEVESEVEEADELGAGALAVGTDIPEGIPISLHAAYADDAPRAFNGRVIPTSVDNAADAAALFTDVERALRVDGLSDEAYADLGHTEQLIVRTLIRNEDWIPEFIAAVPEDLRPFAELHIEARQQLGLHVGDAVLGENVPPWEIIDPAPLEDLVSFYKAAGEATGIDWEVLAGVNLVETVIGRINGVSSAGAQGPMQFLPTTWPEVSQGGDVLDPEDAIHGAARYLVQRGGLENINDGLWGYNNSFTYGNAVLAYADMLRLDEDAFRGFYNWEVYVGSVEGTLWLPVGFNQTERIPAAEYLAANPWAQTLGR